MRALALVVAVCVLGCSSSSGDAAAVDAATAPDFAVDTAGTNADTAAADADAAVDAASDSSCRLHKPYSSKNAVCNACAQAKCCATLNECFDDPRCDDDYVNCALACALFPDDAGADTADVTGACLADCAAKYPAGKAEYDAAIGCAEAACVDECR